MFLLNNTPNEIIAQPCPSLQKIRNRMKFKTYVTISDLLPVQKLILMVSVITKWKKKIFLNSYQQLFLFVFQH